MIADIGTATRVAARALAFYGNGPNAAISFVKYRENYVFRVDEAHGSYALRLHRSGYRTDAEIREELDLITALADAGVAVPRVHPTLAGGAFCRVTDDDGDVHQVDMTVWVPDAVPFGEIGDAFVGVASVDPASFNALGALIAELHNAASALKRESTSIRPAWDANGLVGESPVWGDPRCAFADGEHGREVVDQAMLRLGTELRAYGKRPERYGTIHADFTPENVLIRNGQLTIIDFDDSGNGFYLFDLATAAFFYLPRPQSDDVVSALWAGYHRVRPLTDHDRAIWRPMLLARGLTYLGWAADRPGDETSDFTLEHIRPFVVDLATEFVELTRRPAS